MKIVKKVLFWTLIFVVGLFCKIFFEQEIYNNHTKCSANNQKDLRYECLEMYCGGWGI